MPPPVLPDVDPEITVSSDLPLDLATAVSEAYAIRPEVLNAATAVRISERNVDLARRGRRPDVSLSGQYLFTPDAAGFSANERSWNIGAQLTVPIFEGGLTRARVDQAQADLSAARDTLESVRQAVALEVRTGLLDLQEAARRRQTAAANVVQAREALRIAQVRFRSGVSTTVEVTDAQVAFTQARSNQVSADFDYLTAEAQLRRAVGRLVPSETRTQLQTSPGPPPPSLERSLGDWNRPDNAGGSTPSAGASTPTNTDTNDNDQPTEATAPTGAENSSGEPAPVNPAQAGTNPTNVEVVQ